MAFQNRDLQKFFFTKLKNVSKVIFENEGDKVPLEIQILRSLNSRVKIYRCLQNASEPRILPNYLTQNEWSRLYQTSRESMNRTIKKLEKQSLVKWERNQILIPDEMAILYRLSDHYLNRV